MATIIGTLGNDSSLNGDLNSIVEDDVIVGLAGDDTVNGLVGDDILVGDSGNDNLAGGIGNDTLLGGDDNDTLAGNEGNDLIKAGAGSDRIIWKHNNRSSASQDGNDSIDGGSGTDVMEININDLPSTQNSFILLAPRQFDVNSVVFSLRGTPSSRLLVRNVELFEVTSILGDNLFEVGDLTGSGITRVTFNGSAAADELDGSATSTPLVAHVGNSADLLIGGIGDDTLFGDQGDDIISGNRGSDRFVWNEGDGNDRIDGGTAPGLADQGEIDVVEVNGSNSLLTGDIFTLGLNAATPNPLDATLQRTNLTAVNLTLDAIERFEINGNAGDDRLEVNQLGNSFSARVVFNGGEGNDNLNLISVNSNAQLIGFGGIGNDALRGGDNSDSLSGEDGNDTLLGRNGNDILIGGAGNDTLVAGSGFDRFVFNSDVVFSSTSVVGDGNDVDPNLGVDRIADFSADDRIVLDNTTFSALLVNSNGIAPEQFTTITQDNFAATSDHLIVYSLESGRLFYNTDGTAVTGNDGFGTGGLFAIVDNDNNAGTLPPVLTASRFSVVA